jgi:hypothetical protein
MTAKDAYCERCKQLKPDTKDDPATRDEDGFPTRFCDKCWFATKPPDGTKK